MSRLTYVPEAPPQHPESTGVYFQRELYRIGNILGDLSEYSLGVTNTAPTKASVGQIAYADGTNWNPGSGEGLYVYKSTGWTFIA
jgi:hypothetical protein